MTTTRTLSRRLLGLTLASSMALLAGCGGTPPEVDTATSTPTDPPKPATAPAPETTPSKEVPKG